MVATDPLPSRFPDGSSAGAASATGWGTPWQWFKRLVGSPINWSNADKCLLAAVIVWPFCLLMIGSEYYYVKNPAIAPWFDTEYGRLMLPFHTIAFIGGWLAIILASLWARRGAPDTEGLPRFLVHYYAIGFGIVCYQLGPYTNPYIGVVLLGGLSACCLLFDRRSTRSAILWFLIIVLGSTVLEQFGLLPYAPLIRGYPTEAGHLSRWWLGGIGGNTVLIFCVVSVMIYTIFYRWRDREVELAQLSDQLGRANDLISRYVAAQVAESIRTGDLEAIETPARRRLTIFFSDIKNFTATSDRMEPEDLAEMLNEYLTEMTLVAEKYEATIDKFVGDAIMAFFGAPRSTNDRDHALRAVRMALEMQERVGELRRGWIDRGFEQGFEIRIGVNTGQASVGNFGCEGRMDYTAIGRQVNLAARLEVNCEPNKVLISHTTWSLVRDAIPCVPKGEIQVKGFRDPVKVYEVDA